MIELKDLNFSETCCGKHSFVTEKIREDGVGFIVQREADSDTYTVQRYATDGRTLLDTKQNLSEVDMLNFVNLI